MVKYCKFDKCIITIDEDDIIYNITNLDETKQYKRIGSGKNTYICGQKLPKYFSDVKFDSIDILKKVYRLFDKTIDKNSCGLYRDYYYNGKIKYEYFHNKGIKEGLYKEYFLSGNICIECFYVNDKLNGSYKKYFDKENSLQIECTYNDNIIDGIYKEYHTGHINLVYTEINYVAGKKNGKFITIYKTSIITGTYLDNFVIEQIEKNNNDIIILKKYPDENNIELFVIETYYNSCKIKEKYTVNKKDLFLGNYISFYESGNIYTKKYFKTENKSNNYIIYYETGQIKEEMKYDDITNISTTISYYENGNIKGINKTLTPHTFYHSEYYDIDGIITSYADYEYGQKIEYKFSKNKNMLNKEKIKEFAQKLFDSIKD